MWQLIILHEHHETDCIVVKHLEPEPLNQPADQGALWPDCSHCLESGVRQSQGPFIHPYERENRDIQCSKMRIAGFLLGDWFSGWKFQVTGDDCHARKDHQQPYDQGW